MFEFELNNYPESFEYGRIAAVAVAEVMSRVRYDRYFTLADCFPYLRRFISHCGLASGGRLSERGVQEVTDMASDILIGELKQWLHEEKVRVLAMGGI